MGSIHTHAWHGTSFGKTHFGPLFVAFLVPKWPIFRPVWTLEGPIGDKTGPK